MKTLNTAAKNAENEVYSLLSAENHIYRPWQLIDHNIQPLRLQVTKEEITSYLQVDAFVRPGFLIEHNTVDVPHLFVKIDGDYPELMKSLKKIQKIKPEKVTFIDNVLLINKKPITSFFTTKPDWYDDEQGIDIDKAMEETIDSLMLLKPQYRKNYLKAVDRVIKSVSKGSILIKNPTSRVILETLIYNNRKVVEMFHDFDYQYMVPKLVINIDSEKMVSIYAVLRMMLMSELGFDVIVMEKEGYSSLENILSSTEFDIYCIRDIDTITDTLNSDEKERKKGKEKSLKVVGVFFLFITLITLLFATSFVIFGLSISNIFFW